MARKYAETSACVRLAQLCLLSPPPQTAKAATPEDAAAAADTEDTYEDFGPADGPPVHVPEPDAAPADTAVKIADIVAQVRS